MILTMILVIGILLPTMALTIPKETEEVEAGDMDGLQEGVTKYYMHTVVGHHRILFIYVLFTSIHL